jgi:trimeric autotransporter adhesin
LNINTSVQTQIESGAIPIAGIITDFAGSSRNATTPDIGAWEGNYTPVTQDIAAPSFLNNGFTTSACGLSGRTYTINITDATGVATGSLAPRVYYSINGAPYTSVGGSLTSGTTLNGVWTFSLTYAASPNDIVSYFVVAQDVAGTPNLGALPGGGFAGTSVNNVTSNPTNPFNYTVNTTLGGTYNVGVTGTFTTLTAAANAYNSACLTSSVTFVLTDPSYSANETFPIVFLNNSDASTTNSLLVIPAPANAAVITTGTTYTNSTIKFLNARYITFDGLNTGGSSLDVINTQTSTAATAVVWLASATGSVTGNNFIALKRLKVSSALTSSGKYGVLAALNSANPVVTAGPDNDNITIEGNVIDQVYYGIYAAGSGTLAAGANNGWAIISNTIGTIANNVGYRCVFLSNAQSPLVNNNSLGHIFPGASGASGVYLSAGVDGASVSQNTITNITTTVAASGTGAANGVYLGTNVINTTLDRNIITGLTNTSNTGYAARGVIVTTGTGGINNRITNNMISNISGTGGGSALYWPIGIALEGSSAGTQIDFNTVNLESTVAGLNTATASAAIYINTTGSNNIIRNNIL